MLFFFFFLSPPSTIRLAKLCGPLFSLALGPGILTDLCKSHSLCAKLVNAMFFFSFWGWGRDPYGMGNSSSNVSWDHTRNQSRCCKLLSIRSRVVSTKFFVFQCSAMSYSGEDRKRRGALPPAEPGAATPLDAKEENGRPAPGAAMPMDAKAENDRMVRRRMVFFVRKGKKNVQLCFETCKMGIYVFCRWEEGVVMRFNLLGQVATLGPQFIHLSVIPTDSCP